MIPEIGILPRFLLGFNKLLGTKSSETPVLVKFRMIIINKLVGSGAFIDTYSRDALKP